MASFVSNVMTEKELADELKLLGRNEPQEGEGKQEQKWGDVVRSLLPRRRKGKGYGQAKVSGREKKITACVRRRLPVFAWAPHYDWKRQFLSDIIIGISLGSVIAPKALGHGLLAQVTPIQGLYTAFFGMLLYTFLGVNPWLSMSTGALQSMMFGQALLQLQSSFGSIDKVSLDALLVFNVGLITLFLGLARADKLFNLMSPAAISAFTVGAAFLIMASQLPYFTGIHETKSTWGGFPLTVIDLVAHIEEWNWADFGLGITSVVFLLASKQITKQVKRRWGYTIPDFGPLVLVILSIVVSVQLDLASKGVKVIGAQANGFPKPQLSFSHGANVFGSAFVTALPVAIINFILTLSVSTGIFTMYQVDFAEQEQKKDQIERQASAPAGPRILDRNQETFTLAIVNLVGSCFGAILGTSSFSGSSLLANYKPRSLLPNFFGAVLILVIMTSLGGVIAPLPKVTLGAIIIVALLRLIDFRSLKETYKVSTEDTAVWLLTFVLTFVSSVQIGVYVAIVVSIAQLVWKAFQANVVELGRLGTTGIYRNLDNFQQAERVQQCVILRIDSAFNFANAQKICEKMLEIVQCQQVAAPAAVILVFDSINTIDLPSMRALCWFASECRKQDKEVVYSGVKAGVRRTLGKASKLPEFKEELLFDDSSWFLDLDDCVRCMETKLYTKGRGRASIEVV